jgi:hypothetical protein
MKKEAIIFLTILIVVYGCSQGTGKSKTAGERLAEGDYADKTASQVSGFTGNAKVYER